MRTLLFLFLFFFLGFSAAPVAAEKVQVRTALVAVADAMAEAATEVATSAYGIHRRAEEATAQRLVEAAAKTYAEQGAAWYGANVLRAAARRATSSRLYFQIAAHARALHRASDRNEAKIAPLKEEGEAALFAVVVGLVKGINIHGAAGPWDVFAYLTVCKNILRRMPEKLRRDGISYVRVVEARARKKWGEAWNATYGMPLRNQLMRIF